MLEIKILVSDIDYDGAVELAAPAAADKLAVRGGLMGKLLGNKKRLLWVIRKYLNRKSQAERDKLAADLSARYRGQIIEKAAAFAAEKGVTLQIRDISVRNI